AAVQRTRLHFPGAARCISVRPLVIPRPGSRSLVFFCDGSLSPPPRQVIFLCEPQRSHRFLSTMHSTRQARSALGGAESGSSSAAHVQNTAGNTGAAAVDSSARMLET